MTLCHRRSMLSNYGDFFGACWCAHQKDLTDWGAILKRSNSELPANASSAFRVMQSVNSSSPGNIRTLQLQSDGNLWPAVNWYANTSSAFRNGTLSNLFLRRPSIVCLRFCKYFERYHCPGGHVTPLLLYAPYSTNCATYKHLCPNQPWNMTVLSPFWRMWAVIGGLSRY